MWFFLISATYVVRINANSAGEVRSLVENLISHGLDDIAHVDYGKGLYVDVVVGDRELSFLHSEGYRYSIVEDFYRTKGIINFGPYYTYSEAMSTLSQIHDQYPGLVTDTFSIGTTWESRTIYAVKVTADPFGDNPVFWYNTAIHAREPGGVSVGIGFIDFLTRSYGKNPEVTYLLNNRLLFYVPVANPDGYTYNEVSDGYWRKNKRDNNNDGQFSENDDGVDLNRNFGYMWGADDNGSSPNPGSQVYRGPAPFSEPETQAYREKFNELEPAIGLDMHTYSNLILWPWGYTSDPTPEDTIYRFFAWRMFRHNAYQSYQSYYLYPTNGTTDDWIHGATDEHPLALGWTFEVGESFWQPDSNIIVEQIGENILPLLDFLKASGPYIEIDDFDYTFSGDTVRISISGKNIGFGFQLNSLTATISVPEGMAILIDSVENLGNVGSVPDGYFSASDAFTLIVSDTLSCRNIPVEITFSTPDGFSQNLPMFVAERLDTLFYDDFDGDLSAWTVVGDNVWGIVNGNLTESPSGDYQNNLQTYITPASPLDVSQYQQVKLYVVHKWDIEGSNYNSLDGDIYDWASIDVNASYLGGLWLVLQRYWANHNSYITQEFDLTPYRDTALRVRFKFYSDYSVQGDGWNIDKVLIVGAKTCGAVSQYEPVDSRFGKVSMEQRGRLLNIKVPYNSYVDAGIFTLSGRRIVSQRSFKELNMNLNNLPSGIYVVKVRTTRETLSKKIIVR